MAKNKMQIKYKQPKRQRNKYNPELSNEDSVKSFGITLGCVLVFMGLLYLGALGLEKIGVFEEGYTAPIKDEVAFDYEYIPIGTVFNRNEKNYYVLFDNFDSFKTDNYVNYLLSKEDLNTYKVDMSKKENSKYISDEANKKATNPNELKINDITLIRISNKKITSYITGSESIEEYLSK